MVPVNLCKVKMCNLIHSYSSTEDCEIHSKTTIVHFAFCFCNLSSSLLLSSSLYKLYSELIPNSIPLYGRRQNFG